MVGGEKFCICCVYMLTDSKSVPVIYSSYEKLLCV